MFDRYSYKTLAKEQLRWRYSTPVLAIILFEVIMLFLSVTSVVNEPDLFDPFEYENDYGLVYGYDVSYSSSNGVISFVMNLLSVAVTGVCIISLCRLFLLLQSTREKVPFKEFIYGFSNWLEGILGLLWYMLWVLLWSILFIIPGVVKAYSYSQMFFVLAENPKIGVCKAMRISKIMTKGYKADLFVLDLSFIGWHLLSVLTFGLLQLWIIPYKTMTQVNAYKDMKNYALRTGRLVPSDFS